MDYSQLVPLSFFVIIILIKDVELLTLTVPRNQDVATLGANQFTLSCTYNTDPGETFLVIELFRRRSGETESSIVTFTKDTNVTYGDTSLMTRTTTDWPTAGKTANLVFSSIMCTDKAEYIWKATYVSNQVKYSNQTVNVLVKAITTFNQTAGPITYSPSINLAEGDEVAFTCSGDVGNEPVGYLGWYYYLRSDPTVPVNASSRADATLPVNPPSTCSYTRSSTLKLTMTKEFNEVLVRCTVQQSKYDQFGEGHRQTSNINVSYAPRINKLNSVPVKTEGDSVTLNCSADANPPPTYYWLLPSGETTPGSQLQLNNLTVNDTGEYTCVAYNTYKNDNHTTNTSVRIDVRIKTTTTPTTTTTTTSTGATNKEVSTLPSTGGGGSDDKKKTDTIIIAVCVSLGGVIIIAVAILCYCKFRSKPKEIEEPPEKPRNNQDLSFYGNRPDLVSTDHGKKNNMGTSALNSSFNNSFDSSSDINKPREDGLMYIDLQFDDKPRSRRPIQFSEENLNMSGASTPYADIVNPRV